MPVYSNPGTSTEPNRTHVDLYQRIYITLHFGKGDPTPSVGLTFVLVEHVSSQHLTNPDRRSTRRSPSVSGALLGLTSVNLN